VVNGDALWPQVASATYYGDCVEIDAGALTVNIVGQSSPVLATAVSRYHALLFLKVASVAPSCAYAPVNNLLHLNINVTSPSIELSVNTSEAYSLYIPAVESPAQPGIALTADTVYGAMRALETLAQLVDWRADLKTWTLPVSLITDKPEFQHRGAMIDTSRHFLPISAILQFIDTLAANKLNVLHWHIVDDQSFPFVSASFPNLTTFGAWGAPNPAFVASHVYSPQDVQGIIAYGASWGVRVMPEFDTPGHSTSWGKSQPGLSTPCYTNGVPDGTTGPIDPTNPRTWTFLTSFFAEVVSVFPDHFIHLGGDEVSYTCWQSNPNVVAWMAAQVPPITTFQALEGYYVQRVLDLVGSLGKSYHAWQEVFDNGLKLDPSTVVGAWKYHSTGSPDGATEGALTWQGEVYNITAAGFNTVVSAPWYLNYIAYGLDWQIFWTTDLRNFNGTLAQEELVMGGEICMWGEFVDNTNLHSRMWPRASAAAEALWTNPGASGNFTEAEGRMNAHRCRLLNRGIPAEPATGPFFCPQEWVQAYSPPWAPAGAA